MDAYQWTHGCPPADLADADRLTLPLDSATSRPPKTSLFGFTTVQLAISNLAWSSELEPSVAAMLAAQRVAGIEVAATQVWQRPLAASRREVLDYRRFWTSRGIRIVALQSLLAGRPDLELDPDNGPTISPT